jgi:hypothetical protein
MPDSGFRIRQNAGRRHQPHSLSGVSIAPGHHRRGAIHQPGESTRRLASNDAGAPIGVVIVALAIYLKYRHNE